MLSAVRAGDITYNKMWTSKGAFGVVQPEQDGFAATMEYPLFAARDGMLSSDFLGYVFRQPKFWATARALCKGTTQRARLNPNDFLRLEIELPPLQVQENISSTLSTIDKSIRANEEAIARTKELKQALAHELLTRGIPGRHMRFKDSTVGRIPAEWEVQHLHRVARVERGKFTHRPRNDPSMYGGDTPFVQTGDITGSGWYLHGYTQTLSNRGLAVSRVFPPGTILLAIAQTRENIGAVTITRFPVAFPDSVVGIIPHDPFVSEYIFVALSHAQSRVIEAATESAQANINLEVLRRVSIVIPEPNERQEIVRALHSIEQSLSEAADSLSIVEVAKQNLLSFLLGGQPQQGV